MTGKLPYICGFTVLNLLLVTLVYASPVIVEGESCERSEFVQSCDGDTLYVCSGNQGVVARDCTNQNKVCVDFGSNSERFISAADCFEDDDVCENAGEIVMKEQVLPSGMSIQRGVQCEKSTDGRLYYRLLKPKYYPARVEKREQLEQKKAQRAEEAENRKAQQAIIDKYKTETCDPNTYKLSCDGDILLRCGNDKLVKPIACSRQGKTCIDFGNNSAQFIYSAACLDETDKCENAGEIVSRDNAPNSRVQKRFQCVKSKNGELYYGAIRASSNSANANDLRKIYAMRNQTAGILVLEETSKGKHEGNACKTENALTEICEVTSRGLSVVVSYQCIKNADGNLVLYKHSVAACDSGAGTCSKDGKCLPGKSCSPEKFKSKCHGNDATRCLEGKVHHIICQKDETCSVIDGVAECSRNAKKENNSKSSKKQRKKANTTDNTSSILLKKSKL